MKFALENEKMRAWVHRSHQQKKEKKKDEQKTNDLL